MEHQPNIVEAAFVDAWGQTWTFHDKTPIFMVDYLDAESSYPHHGSIACDILGSREHDGRRILTITTGKIESTSGDMQFDVFPEHLTML